MKYNDLMNSISVDSDMKKRILLNLEKKENFEVKQIETKKVIPFKMIYRYSAMAACLIIAFIAGGFFQLKSDIKTVGENVEILEDSYTVSNSLASNIIECNTIEELQDRIGFEINNIKSVPFEIKNSEYYIYWGNIAEISYEGEDNFIRYRISKGFTDNSGNYTTFEDILECENNEKLITMKGQNDKYNLVLWNDNGFSYSLYINKPVSEEVILQILNYE